MKDVKFCVNCKWCCQDVYYSGLSSCTHPAFANIISGISTLNCGSARLPVHKCGVDAKLFEPKVKRNILSAILKYFNLKIKS